MTAYGRSSIDTFLGRLSAEVQSLNRKFLEINCFLPKELGRFEADIRKYLSEKVLRGCINVKISASFYKKTPLMVRPNIPLARQIKAAWDEIAKDLGVEQSSGFSLDMLAYENNGILLFDEDMQDEELYRNAIFEVLEQALKGFLEMKSQEGKALFQDIQTRLANLRQGIERIAEFAPEATNRHRQKLIERLEELIPGSVENEERILREIGIYAEKIDIAEEITRFQSHLKQFSDLLSSSELSIGKTLEFIIQELNREINTIGSKSSHVQVSRLVVEIKGELERIREQIQNVE